MRWLMVFGVTLIVAGIASLFVNVLPFHHREEVAKIGPLTASRDEETDIYVPPYAGIIIVAAGVTLVVVGRRK